MEWQVRPVRQERVAAVAALTEARVPQAPMVAVVAQVDVVAVVAQSDVAAMEATAEIASDASSH